MNESLEKYYRLLELEPGATLEEIKESFRTLSRVWHPDRHPPESKPYVLALKKQKELNDAYDALKRHVPSAKRTAQNDVSQKDNGQEQDLWWCPSQTKSETQNQEGASDSLALWFASNEKTNVEANNSARRTTDSSTSSYPETWYEAESNRRQRGEQVVDSDNTLSRNAESNVDPDEDKLTIQWDKWRNDVLFALYEKFGERLNNPQEGELRWNARRKQFVSIFPIGTTAAFSFDVSIDRRTSNAKILASSGIAEFDQLIAECIAALSGKQILAFPRGSSRTQITQYGSLGIGRTSKFEQSDYGDIETQSAVRNPDQIRKTSNGSSGNRIGNNSPVERKGDNPDRLPVPEKRPLR